MVDIMRGMKQGPLVIFLSVSAVLLLYTLLGEKGLVGFTFGLFSYMAAFKIRYGYWL